MNMANVGHRIRVGVLRGGLSPEFDVSIKTGASVLKNLPAQYRAHDILLAKDGGWHLDGMPMADTRIFDTVDVIFNALHGVYGEDGKVQRYLDSHGVRYTGSGAVASALGMNKIRAKEIVTKAGIKTSPWVVCDIETHDPDVLAHMVYKKFAPPWVVKDPFGGSSIGVHIVKTRDELLYIIEKMFLGGMSCVLVEEYVNGREATCGVIDNFRNTRQYVLPVVEIVPPKERTFFDYECKYDGSTHEICPARFTSEQKRAIEDATACAYQALGCRHYARVDFILTPQGPIFLEINTLPGLTEQSILPKAVQAIGSSYGDFLSHLIQLALL